MNQSAKELFNKPFLSTLRALSSIDAELVTIIRQLNSGEKKLLKIILNNQLLHLSVIAKELTLEGEAYKLLSIQNIKSELDEKELESWQKLIWILTHEIKNSAIPISTLTEVITQIMIDEKGNMKALSSLDNEELEDIRIGMLTVEKRSKGLVKFVDAYGRLARVPDPKLITVNVSDLLIQVHNLMKNELKRSAVNVMINAEPHITIKADPDLIEQVLINLIKNAKEALLEINDPIIEINVFQNQSGSVIAINDNGPGIPPNRLDNIFIPFFSTKKEGSGIGLSLSRQIMRAHKGSISVSTSPEEGTTFYLNF